ncbi:hypothetical protein ACFVW8_32225 [Streptomyces sp. NPDC058221]|uniref:hypothetical protein n=1 Tax=Streptomyces sp. NPDC058221 TaxID=3346388 RepID=UPI0036E06CB0
MNVLTFDGLRGAYALSSAVVLATPAHAAALRDALPHGSAVHEVPHAQLRSRRDPASRLGELAAGVHAESHPPGGEAFRRGVFISTRRGNQASVRKFALGLAAGRRSPSTFSVAGYNIVAQSVAQRLPAQGPSVVLAGRGAGLDGACLLGALRLAAGAVDTAYVGHITWLPDAGGRGGEGLAVLAALERVSGTDADGTDAVRLDPRALYARSPAAPGLGQEDHAALRRVAALLAERVPVGAA